MTLDETYNRLGEKDIEIVEWNLIKKPVVATKINEQKLIAIDNDKFVNQREKKFALMEELGHFEMNALYLPKHINDPLKRVKIMKAERIARDFALRELVPLVELEPLIMAKCEIWDIADHFSINECQVVEAIEMYVRKNLIKISQ